MRHLDEGMIHAWLDGALPEEEARQAELHVAACQECGAAVAEARGFIAASSMILSKLDDAPAEAVGGAVAAGAALRGPASPRLAGESGAGRPVVRRWLGGAGMRAAALVLVLAGGAALIGRATRPDDLARVAEQAAMETSAPAVGDAAARTDATLAAEDATAASMPAAAPAPPPVPTVGPASALPRPRPAVGTGAVAPTRESDGGRAAELAVGARVADMAERAGAADMAAKSGAMAGANVASGLGGSVSPPPAAEQRLEAEAQAALAGARRVAPAVAPEVASAEQAPAPTSNAGGLASQRLRVLSAGEGPARGALPRAALAEPSQGFIAGAAARCYVLTLTPWSPATGGAPLAPPGAIVLSPDTGTDGPARGHRLVRPMGADVGEGHEAAWWTPLSPTGVVLTWTRAGEGIVMRLRAVGDDLAGTARTFGAPDDIERTSEVTARAVACAAAR